MSAPAGGSAYALLADGTMIEIRHARPGDFDAVREMHDRMSPDNLYLRFFSLSRASAERAARRICREPAPDHAALVAVLEGEVIGCGTYERLGAASASAEVALAVADDMHRRGVGTLLLEHLVSLARVREVRTLVAETLTEPAVLQHPQAAGDALREHRHVLDAPRLLALVEHARAQLTDPVGHPQPGQLGAVRHRAEQAQARSRSAAASPATAAGSSAGTSWVTQPITRACSPEAYPAAAMDNSSAR